jgi:tetratricopeptide (TPR) repeat protein
MTLGPVMTFTASLLLQSHECRMTDEAPAGLRAQFTGDDAEYLRLVNLYRDGRREEAVRGFRNLNRVAVERLIRRWAPGMTDRCLQAATLLETDYAMDLAERSRWEEADSLFDQAWQISFLVEPPANRLRFQRNWLLATGLFHHQLIFVNMAEEAFSRAAGLLRRAAQLYPNDPEVLLASGSLLEWSGSLRGGNPEHLKEAEELYALARRLSPDEPEILLRHGLVLEKLERRDEAAPPLQRLLELDARKDLIYRSRMVLGRIAERAGRLPEAIAHYSAAAEAVPSWQVAYLAASHALHGSGSHDRAREVLERALSIPAKTADEALGGWWSYELGIALRFEPILDGLRAEAMR